MAVSFIREIRPLFFIPLTKTLKQPCVPLGTVNYRYFLLLPALNARYARYFETFLINKIHVLFVACECLPVAYIEKTTILLQLIFLLEFA